MQYLFDVDGLQIPQNHGRSVTVPSSLAAARNALYRRTTSDASKVLKETNINVGKKTVRINVILNFISCI